MRRILNIAAALLGLLTAATGLWGLWWPESFSEVVGFSHHQHFVHGVGAFQFGIGMTLLLAMIWADTLAAVLTGYLFGATAHTVNHVINADLGGSAQQTLLVAFLAALSAMALVARWRALGWVIGRVEAASSPALAPFTRQKTVLLTTYRRNGTPVATPVSIAVAGDRAYVRSFEKAWKTRRIRRNATVSVAPSTARDRQTGPAMSATVRLLAGAEYREAARALARKYPMLHGVLVPLAHRFGRSKTGRTVHFEIRPDADPAGPVVAVRRNNPAVR